MNAPLRTVRAGFREDIGIYVRSAWEANYARYLNWLKSRGEIEDWEYEPQTFWFDKIKTGTRCYKPDFRVRERGKVYFVEIKGWMDPKSKTKIKRMRIYHPDIDLRVIDERQYKATARVVCRIIKGWE